MGQKEKKSRACIKGLMESQNYGMLWVEGTSKGPVVQTHGQGHLSSGSEVQVDDVVDKILHLLTDRYKGGRELKTQKCTC